MPVTWHQVGIIALVLIGLCAIVGGFLVCFPMSDSVAEVESSGLIGCALAVIGIVLAAAILWGVL